MRLLILLLSPCIILLYTTRSTADPASFIAFYETGQSGAFWRKTNLGDGQCANIPEMYYNDKAKSVTTLGTCVRFWENIDCTGDHTDIRPGSPSHYDLSAFGWANKMSSVGTCT